MVPTKQSLGSLKLLYEISRELTSSLDLRVVLERVLSLSLQSMEGSNGSIIVLDEQGAPLDAAMIVGQAQLIFSANHTGRFDTAHGHFFDFELTL